MSKFLKALAVRAISLMGSRYGSRAHPPSHLRSLDTSTVNIGEEAALKRLIAKKVKEVSGSGVIRTPRHSREGDSYFFGNVLITDTDIKDEYIVFRYQ